MASGLGRDSGNFGLRTISLSSAAEDAALDAAAEAAGGAAEVEEAGHPAEPQDLKVSPVACFRWPAIELNIRNSSAPVFCGGPLLTVLVTARDLEA